MLIYSIHLLQSFTLVTFYTCCNLFHWLAKSSALMHPSFSGLFVTWAYLPASKHTVMPKMYHKNLLNKPYISTNKVYELNPWWAYNFTIKYFHKLCPNILWKLSLHMSNYSGFLQRTRLYCVLAYKMIQPELAHINDFANVTYTCNMHAFNSTTSWVHNMIYEIKWLLKITESTVITDYSGILSIHELFMPSSSPSKVTFSTFTSRPLFH